jgi:Fur family ferric uptake transcriptional regulator
MKTEMNTALTELKKAGFRQTRSSKKVLEYLITAHGPHSIEGIHKAVQSKASACNITTIYRVIARFEELGLVRRTDFDNGRSHYEFFSGDHKHHHLICKSCKKIESFSDSLSVRLSQIARDRGFQSINPWLEVYGICGSCE